MKEETLNLLNSFFKEHACLSGLRAEIIRAVEALANVSAPNKIMVCGNGGSFADSGHIVGELMKSFKKKRAVDAPFSEACADVSLCEHLEGAVPAIALGASSPLASAIINDIGSEFVYAQQVYGLGCPGDILIGISTSGNSATVLQALKTGRAKGIMTIGLSGHTGGKMKELCDILLNVPETETYRVQELHLPLYHVLCACVEEERW